MSSACCGLNVCMCLELLSEGEDPRPQDQGGRSRLRQVQVAPPLLSVLRGLQKFRYSFNNYKICVVNKLLVLFKNIYPICISIEQIKFVNKLKIILFI